jgi:hypothetical protein
MRGLAAAHPEAEFLHCYRAHRLCEGLAAVGRADAAAWARGGPGWVRRLSRIESTAAGMQAPPGGVHVSRPVCADGGVFHAGVPRAVRRAGPGGGGARGSDHRGERVHGVAGGESAGRRAGAAAGRAARSSFPSGAEEAPREKVVLHVGAIQDAEESGAADRRIRDAARRGMAPGAGRIGRVRGGRCMSGSRAARGATKSP